jgi:hypothetical protein
MKCNNFYKSAINKFVLLFLLIVSIEVQSLEAQINSEYNNFSVIYFFNFSVEKNIQKKTC